MRNIRQLIDWIVVYPTKSYPRVDTEIHGQLAPMLVAGMKKPTDQRSVGDVGCGGWI
jgi:hypothetical protein